MVRPRVITSAVQHVPCLALVGTLSVLAVPSCQASTRTASRGVPPRLAAGNCLVRAEGANGRRGRPSRAPGTGRAASSPGGRAGPQARPPGSRQRAQPVVARQALAALALVLAGVTGRQLAGRNGVAVPVGASGGRGRRGRGGHRPVPPAAGGGSGQVAAGQAGRAARQVGADIAAGVLVHVAAVRVAGRGGGGREAGYGRRWGNTGLLAGVPAAVPVMVTVAVAAAGRATVAVPVAATAAAGRTGPGRDGVAAAVAAIAVRVPCPAAGDARGAEPVRAGVGAGVAAGDAGTAIAVGTEPFGTG